jgi:glyoxylase-like metal-dependent hydrolase (beta-lactamase superfamily II)
MKLYSIDTGLFKLDGGAMFGVVPKSIWNKINAADDANMCTWALRCLLIEDEGRLILIDTGIGNKQDQKFFGHYYLHGDAKLDGSLAKHGFHRDDITDVILTHLHFDHCGGAILRDGEDLVPAFKNAKYWSNEEHWEWAVKPNDREKASFLKENIIPIEQSGQLHYIETPNIDWDPSKPLPAQDVMPHVSVRLVEGHTAAMMLPQIKYGDKTIVYMADLLPSAGHVPLPYVMAYDMFPLTTLGEKKSFLTEAVENNYILFFEHDAKAECCSLVQTEKGVRVDEAFSLKDIG